MLKLLRILLAFFYFGLAGKAAAFAITDDLEQVLIPSVGEAFVSVNFTNTYADPIPVCNGTVASSASWTPVVRLRNVTATGMEVRVQPLSNSGFNVPGRPPVAVDTVHCIIADAGAYPLPGAVGTGVWYQAGKHTVSNTFGRGNAANRWNTNDFNDDAVAGLNSGLSGAYGGLDTRLVLVAQIMTYNDPRGQVAYANDCDSRGGRPFEGGFSDGACVSRHIGRLAEEGPATNQSRLPEDVGYIVFRTGDGNFVSNGVSISFSGGLSSDQVASVVNNPPYSYGTGVSLNGAVTMQQGEDGGDGSYSALYGNLPLDGSVIDLAVDESTNADRFHTTEEVAWLGFRTLTIPVDVQKSVDVTNTAGFQTLNYTMTLTNTGTQPLIDANINVSDVLTQGSTALTLTSPVTPSPSNGPTLLPGDTWEFTATYSIVEDNYDANGADDLLNTFTATVSAFGLVTTREATATTQLNVTVNPDVVKTATLAGGAAIPPDGVQVGDVITYTYAIDNRGNVPIANVVLSDDHRGRGAPLQFQSCIVTNDALVQNNTIIGSTPFEIQTLGPRDSVSCTANYTVVQADIDNLQTP